MKTYSVSVRWNHKGNRYPVSSHHRVKGSNVRIAVERAIKEVVKKTRHAGTWSEKINAQIRIDVTVIGNVGKEADDGRGIRDEQQEEP